MGRHKAPTYRLDLTMFWHLLIVVAFEAHSALTHKYESITGVVNVEDYYPTNKKEFGTGYNTIKLQRTYTTAVELSKEQLLNSGFISFKYQIELCETRDEFNKK